MRARGGVQRHSYGHRHTASWCGRDLHIAAYPEHAFPDANEAKSARPELVNIESDAVIRDREVKRFRAFGERNLRSGASAMPDDVGQTFLGHTIQRDRDVG